MSIKADMLKLGIQIFVDIFERKILSLEGDELVNNEYNQRTAYYCAWNIHLF